MFQVVRGKRHPRRSPWLLETTKGFNKKEEEGILIIKRRLFLSSLFAFFVNLSYPLNTQSFSDADFFIPCGE